MGIVQIQQLRHRLNEDFVPHIDQSDIQHHSEEQRIPAVLSRSLAAFTASKRWGLEPQAAAACVTDGSKDGGIDAIAVDPVGSRVLLVQSKWTQSGNGSASKADMLAFREGSRRILQSDWDYFSDRIQARAAEIEEVILNPKVRIEMVFAHSGSDPLSEEVGAEILPFVAENNLWDEILVFDYLHQGLLHGLLLDESRSSIDIEVELSDWGVIEGAALAFYGHIAARDLAEWYSRHRERLFDSNLRATLPDSSVNEGIIATALNEPEHFWYFNNGVTVLCETVAKAPAGGSDRRVGHFAFTRVQVVNGAQTVGSVARAFNELDAPEADETGSPEGSVEPRVMIRFIQVGDSYDSLGRAVTRWTNTQNRVGGRDFLALDPEQSRIKAEFEIDGLDYVFRSGEPDPSADKGCGIQEATVALACANSEIRLAVQAKREVSRLWADIEKAPYKQLFNSGTHSIKVWRCVQALRVSEEELAKVRSEATGKSKNFLTHLNRVVAWIVNRIHGTIDASTLSDQEWAGRLDAVRDSVPVVAGMVAHIAEETYPGYPANLAKNATECEAIAERVLGSLATDGEPEEVDN